MAGSAIVAVRKAVIAGLAAEPSLLDVKTTYGYDPDARDRAQIFTMRGSAQTPPASLKSGRNFRDEEATFQLVVHTETPGANNEEGDEAVIALGLIVEEWIADRKDGADLAVSGLNWIRMDSWELAGGPADQSFISQLIYTVRYKARLT